MKPNILFLMTDQQRFDTIAALGNSDIYTPNLDRLAKRGMIFRNAYSTCPVCIPARYTIRTGRFSPTTRYFSNSGSAPVHGQPGDMQERCGGPYLAETMKRLGYRTFGIGKFHSEPWNEDLGFEVHQHSEEFYETPEQRAGDAFARWIRDEHPEFDYVEGLMGERNEMYYMPQMSPLPAELSAENWVAEKTVEQMRKNDERPWFGMASFIAPHPPFSPPLPFNRLYDPDRMPTPMRGGKETDWMDEQIPWMNYIMWGAGQNDWLAQVLKARYYGEITYVDHCIGKILDAVETLPDAENTLICFFSDHGDHLGDHHAWQKETFFEAACHIPFMLSWPARIQGEAVQEELVCLADLFGIATGAAGSLELRDGMDVPGLVEGRTTPREVLFGYHGEPGTDRFKIMVRSKDWKYIFMSNGGKEQLFDMTGDRREAENLVQNHPDIVRSLRKKAAEVCRQPGARDALQGNDFIEFPFTPRPRSRCYQFDRSRGVLKHSSNPRETIDSFFS